MFKYPDLTEDQIAAICAEYKETENLNAVCASCNVSLSTAQRVLRDNNIKTRPHANRNRYSRRNREILDRLAAGEGVSELALTYGLTRQRISAIKTRGY